MFLKGDVVIGFGVICPSKRKPPSSKVRVFLYEETLNGVVYGRDYIRQSDLVTI